MLDLVPLPVSVGRQVIYDAVNFRAFEATILDRLTLAALLQHPTIVSICKHEFTEPDDEADDLAWSVETEEPPFDPAQIFRNSTPPVPRHSFRKKQQTKRDVGAETELMFQPWFKDGDENNGFTAKPKNLNHLVWYSSPWSKKALGGDCKSA
jgi:hypothetical protein